MKLSTRFLLAATGVLTVAFVAAWVLLRLDATGVAIALAALSGILLVLWPVSRLASRGTEAELDRARAAVARLEATDAPQDATGGPNETVGAEGAGRGGTPAPTVSLGRATYRVGGTATPTPGSGLGQDVSLDRVIDRAAGRLLERLDSSERASDDLRALFDGLEDGVAIIDEDGLVALCNPAFERWAGRDVTPGTRIGTLFRTPRIAEAVQAAGTGRPDTAEIELGDHTVLMSVRPHRSGALIQLHDLTAIRRLEGVRRDFVANVSHELKTPLTSVVGFAEALAEGGIDDDPARDFAQRILANATRMRHLVEDLLDLSFLESGSWSPSPEPVSIAAVAAEVWDSLPPSVRPDQQLTVSTGTTEPAADTLPAGGDPPSVPRAYVDPAAIRQILRNLLDNAVRYSEADPHVSLRILASDHDEHGASGGTGADIKGGGVLRIEITDRGPGIASVHVERVFERFYRIDPARSRERGGTGLGLAIVKHLVEAHGGEVGMDSALGQGTTVWFTLPAATSSTPTDYSQDPASIQEPTEQTSQ